MSLLIEKQNALSTAQAQFESVAVTASKTQKKLSGILSERHAKVEALREERKQLAEQIEAVYEEYKPALEAATDENDAAIRGQDKALTEINRAFFEEAQARIEIELAPADMVAELDRIIDSKRQWHITAGSIGLKIVIQLCQEQPYRGFNLGNLEYVDCLTVDRGYGGLGKKQVARAWAYLQKVCIEREDEGLAPPFKIDWMGWIDPETNHLSPMLLALFPKIPGT